MLTTFNQFFAYKGKNLEIKNSYIAGKENKFPIKNDIPRFTPDDSYSKGNFSKLREKHATLQLDSLNGTSDRLNTVMNRTNWPKDFFRGKTVLECGCGAGPDTEILLSLGAKVLAVDIAGVDIAKANLESNPNFKNVQFVQDSINNLHLKPHSFDIVFCHRVLQHTPKPSETLNHILQFAKKDGHVFVHSYSNSRFQMWRWKYALLPLTRNLPSELLYKTIKLYAWPAFYFTNFLNKFKIGRWLAHVFVPFYNYRSSNKFAKKSDRYIVEYGIHDTFDALSPRYDKPMPPRQMQEIAKKHLSKDFEIYTDTGMTLLRTKI